jgi:hypothetical protein
MSTRPISTRQYSRLTVKNLRSCEGNEGPAYSATLYLDGRKVGHVRNDGNGGMTFVEFWKKSGGKVVRDVEAERAVLAYVAEQPDVDMGEDPGRPGERWMMKADLEWVASQVVEDALEDQEYRRWCRTKVVFRLEGDRDGHWRTIKASWKKQGAEVRAHLVKKYGSRLAEILNERFAA